MIKSQPKSPILGVINLRPLTTTLQTLEEQAGQGQNNSFAVDGMYIKLDEEHVASWQGPLGNNNTAQLNADLNQQIYSLSAGRRALNKQTKVDILGVQGLPVSIRG